jgi:hypothetical protein
MPRMPATTPTPTKSSSPDRKGLELAKHKLKLRAQKELYKEELGKLKRSGKAKDAEIADRDAQIVRLKMAVDYLTKCAAKGEKT